MSDFDDYANEIARPAVQERNGLAVTHVAATDGTETSATALVGEARTERNYRDQGQQQRHEREVTLFVDDVASVSIKDTIRISGEVWQIEEILGESATQTVVRAVRIRAAEVSRGNYRQQV